VEPILSCAAALTPTPLPRKRGRGALRAAPSPALAWERAGGEGRFCPRLCKSGQHRVTQPTKLPYFRQHT